MLEAMEEINSVLEQLETPIQPGVHLKSAIYQPKRISLNSQDDVTVPYGATQFDTSVFQYNSFRISLSRPVLYAKSVQLLRATIPTPFPTIPDGECVFWYYRIPTGVSPVAPFAKAYLCYVRLIPSFVGPLGTNYGYNRTFQGYTDVVTELNKAAANDPTVNDNTTYPRYYGNGVVADIPADVTFGFDTRFNKFTFVGNNPSFRYIPASYNDANLQNATVLNNFNLVTAIEYDAGPPALYLDQPVTPYRPLELRLGWTYSGYSPIVYWNNIATVGNPIYAFGYADLVNTQDVYVYLDFILGGTLDSAGNGNLLSVVPLATSNLGVGFYNNVLSNPITQLPETISDIQVRLLTDTGAPFNLPNNAIVNLEIGFLY